MIKENYCKAYKEVIEVLRYVPREEVVKIPRNMLKIFKENYDRNYNFKIDTTKPFKEQKIMDETKAIFANIYKDYWATPEQKKEIIRREFQEIAMIEREKSRNYNPDDLFKNRKKKNMK